MTILVTGGGGFLGRAIIDLLLAGGHDVRAYQRSSQPRLEAKGVEIFQGDLTDRAALENAADGCDAIFHSAAKAGVWGPEADYFKANVIGTRNVIQACRTHGIRYLVYTSTPSVVATGESHEGADESLPYAPKFLCAYPKTKAAAEAEVLGANDHKLATVALRPHLIWGVGDPHIIPRLIARARKGRLKVVGNGENIVDMTHVKNAAHAHVLALEALKIGKARGQAYFISDNAPVNLWSWVDELLVRTHGKPLKGKVPLPVAYRLGAALEWVYRNLPLLSSEPPMTRFVAKQMGTSHWFNVAAAQRDLGYEPLVNLATGMEEVERAWPWVN